MHFWKTALGSLPYSKIVSRDVVFLPVIVRQFEDKVFVLLPVADHRFAPLPVVRAKEREKEHATPFGFLPRR